MQVKMSACNVLKKDPNRPCLMFMYNVIFIIYYMCDKGQS